NYPFCTIDPNIGIVNAPDERLEQIAGIFHPEKILPAMVEFVDIAGLVRGASKGEGLGNQFLGHIREVGAIIHVVRCFEDENITHVEGSINPLRDIETIHIELALADLETVQKRLNNLSKYFKSQDKEVVKKAKISEPVLQKLAKALEEGIVASQVSLDQEEIESIDDLHLVTLKKQLYVCNVDEAAMLTGNNYVRMVEEKARKEGNEVVVICGKIESEIATLATIEEKKDFMQSLGITESGLSKLIKKGFSMLDLCTYFTAGPKEVRAWTFPKGAKAPQAAGVIHTDFERGFIKAEIYNLKDLLDCGSELKVKEKGKLRIEGKEYIVQDGDIIHFRFNV
nr:redox-regulated ATPase YchF [Bacteriovoracaceae bacterium]